MHLVDTKNVCFLAQICFNIKFQNVFNKTFHNAFEKPFQNAFRKPFHNALPNALKKKCKIV